MIQKQLAQASENLTSELNRKKVIEKDLLDTHNRLAEREMTHEMLMTKIKELEKQQVKKYHQDKITD